MALLYLFDLGGPVVMVWCWLIASCGCFCTALCLAEICSTYPQAGSVYFWSAQLANQKYAPVASYLCGWINLIGNLGNSASFASGCATIISAGIMIINGAQISSQIQVAISILLVFFWGLQNLLKIDTQGWINSAGALIQVFGSIIIVSMALAMSSEKATIEFVFTSSYNSTGFENYFYVAMLGVVISLYSYGGFEAAAHLAGKISLFFYNISF